MLVHLVGGKDSVWEPVGCVEFGMDRCEGSGEGWKLWPYLLEFVVTIV